VTPHYAVKSNPHNSVVSRLIDLGASFDCASKGEIKQVLDLGGKPESIIFANPIKFPEDLRYA